jgi:hypothetical protein
VLIRWHTPCCGSQHSRLRSCGRRASSASPDLDRAYHSHVYHFSRMSFSAWTDRDCHFYNECNLAPTRPLGKISVNIFVFFFMHNHAPTVSPSSSQRRHSCTIDSLLSLSASGARVIYTHQRSRMAAELAFLAMMTRFVHCALRTSINMTMTSGESPSMP